MVRFNKVWEINTKADYDKAMEELKEADFLAEMSDDFRAWRTEKAEVARQMTEVKRQAAEKGII